MSLIFRTTKSPFLLFFFILTTILFNISPVCLASKEAARDVLYGAVITHCAVPGTVALTFDDGPGIYTPQLLDLLSEYGARSTFFVNGYQLSNHHDILVRTLNEGHQIGSHTYDHARLSALPYGEVVEQMRRLEAALYDTLGVVPMYMRPPYLAINGEVLAAMGELGYHVISTSVDTKDYAHDHPDLIPRSFTRFLEGLNAGGSVVLAHDTHEQTVATLTRAMLDEIVARGLVPVPVGECLGDPEYNWYR
ncbi:chitin deacetylase [Aspergillus brunneoviolaceus CBS 621.78]|uniref:Polysaccharide deacetylase family protein n=1 Tax=Aspergillus brunneoviolaceus CBS 621.78 TaxID=1450534 RepID=A0ACD1GQV6_9EURO|nr:polysaccharide deacetylase family protein [Aspergillus brunneoviolaceus CBS 621.78]RAH51565.1 polysaccharide deacetylase family protein [Aspergillus brunneoviolaceus CBS 621.78]